MTVLGVDVGGTFTDFFCLEEGRLRVYKRPSTPDDPAVAVLAGIAENRWRPDEVVHGSTVATNTVLERKGARTALVTTRGFRDLLEIGRQARPRIYDLEPRRPPPLVPRELCFEAAERLDHRGEVLLPLADTDLRGLVEALQQARPEAVAVCLLFAFLNPRHEQWLGEALRSAGFEVSLSSEVLPEVREYERASTTVLNAYVGSQMREYLTRLEAALTASGCRLLSVIQSNGGTAAASQAASLPAATLLSGPAAGVAGAFAVASRAGFDKVLTFDMGGTSTDVCLCPGRIPFTSEWSIAGLPVRLPAVDVHTVGAGGGSVAWLDEGGALRVGPRSAGAVPGPAAYGRGGPPTTTDAHLALGNLDETSFLGGRFAVDRRAALEALESLGMGNAGATGRGIVQVANSVMERALRVVSVERGFDPSDFTLVAFGGAGPLHACELAAALRMRNVLVPRYPGVLCAEGMLWADTMRDYSMPLIATLSPAAGLDGFGADVEARVEALARRAHSDLGRRARTEAALDLRYQGQGYELTVPWPSGGAAALVTAFHAAHEQRFGYANAGRAVESLVVRLRARVPREAPPEVPLRKARADATPYPAARRTLQLDKAVEAPVYARDRLLAGNVVQGPAVVAQMDSTTLVLPGWRATVDAWGNLLLEEA